MSVPSPLRSALIAALVAAGAACGPSGGGAGPAADATDAVPAAEDADADAAGGPADAADADEEGVMADADADAGPDGAGAPTPAELAALVDRAAYEAELVFVAKERPPGSAHWQAVQDRCAEALAAAGLDVALHAYGSGVNVIGTRPGATRPDEIVVLSAHYDHIPGCAGADDNGSGVAALLEAARALGTGRFERTIVLACWDEEETGLVGARAWAAEAKARGDAVVVAVSLETMGYASDEPDSQAIPAGFDLLFPAQVAAIEANERRGDFIILAADEGAQPLLDAFATHAGAIGLPAYGLALSAELLASPLLGDLARSDHAAFWEQGYSGVMVTDSANFRNPHYHCWGGPDVVEDLDLDFAVAVTRAITAAVAAVAGPLPEAPP